MRLADDAHPEPTNVPDFGDEEARYQTCRQASKSKKVGVLAQRQGQSLPHLKQEP